MSFCSLYIPVGVPTYHLETAKDQFDRSCRMLRSVDPDIVCPDEMLLTLDKLRAFLDGANPRSRCFPKPHLCKCCHDVGSPAPL